MGRETLYVGVWQSQPGHCCGEVPVSKGGLVRALVVSTVVRRVLGFWRYFFVLGVPGKARFSWGTQTVLVRVLVFWCRFLRFVRARLAR